MNGHTNKRLCIGVKVWTELSISRSKDLTELQRKKSGRRGDRRQEDEIESGTKCVHVYMHPLSSIVPVEITWSAM